MDTSDSPAVDEGKAASRAEGRPPEEKASQDPTTQAEAILEDSEERTRRRDAAAGADDGHEDRDSDPYARWPSSTTPGWSAGATNRYWPTWPTWSAGVSCTRPHRPSSRCPPPRP